MRSAGLYDTLGLGDLVDEEAEARWEALYPTETSGGAPTQRSQSEVPRRVAAMAGEMTEDDWDVIESVMKGLQRKRR